VGGVADTVAAAIQRDLDFLENWTERFLIKFNKGKYNDLHLKRNNPVYQPVQTGAGQLEDSCAEKDIGVLVSNKLIVRQQCSLVTKANNILDYISVVGWPQLAAKLLTHSSHVHTQ